MRALTRQAIQRFAPGVIALELLGANRAENETSASRDARHEEREELERREICPLQVVETITSGAAAAALSASAARRKA